VFRRCRASIEIDEVFQRERIAISRLCHPGGHRNIVWVLDQGILDAERSHYFDMELCIMNLYQFRREHLVEEVEICEIMRQIADGLAFIHSHGAAHRDLKPENGMIPFRWKGPMLVLLARDGTTWKIADFGLATTCTSRTLIATEYARGTVGYRAPELFGEAGCFNQNSDIWSLGCIFVELITGNKLFSDDWRLIQYKLLDSNMQRQRIQLPAHVSISPAFRASFNPLIQSMLEIEPQNRLSASAITNSFSSFLRTSKTLQPSKLPITREDILPITARFLRDWTPIAPCLIATWGAVFRRNSVLVPIVLLSQLVLSGAIDEHPEVLQMARAISGLVFSSLTLPRIRRWGPVDIDYLPLVLMLRWVMFSRRRRRWVRKIP